MAYQGSKPGESYHNIPAVQRFDGDGSDQTFTLNRTITSVQDVLVSVDGVIQDTEAYSISGTTLTFTEAPSDGTANIFVNYLGITDGTITPPAGFKSDFKADGLFRINSQTLTTTTTITATENASATGPITVNSGVTLTIETGGRLTIL